MDVKKHVEKKEGRTWSENAHHCTAVTPVLPASNRMHSSAMRHDLVLDWQLQCFLLQHAGVAVGQQLLLFAGQVLCPDTALLLEDLGLDRFSLAHEVCSAQ